MIFLSKIITGVLLFVTMMMGCGQNPSIVRGKSSQPQNAKAPITEAGEVIMEMALPSGPAQVPAPKPIVKPVPKKKPLVHKVKWQKETLYSISLWYTGSGKNWRRLAKTNPKIKPHLIKKGDTVLIPEGLLKTHKPLPSEFLRPVAARKNPLPVRSSRISSKKEELPLYGPIVTDASSKPEKNNGLPVALETID